jgi:hypothetical protein
MVSIDDGVEVSGAPIAGLDEGSLLGKRYEHSSGLELLVTKPGAGSLGVGEQALKQKESKPLPSSD